MSQFSSETSSDFAGSDEDVLAELGTRLARRRLARNLTQEALASEAGVSRATVRRLEGGHSTQLTNLIRVLRALRLVEHLDALVPQPRARPLDELERRGRERQRASRRPAEPSADEPESPWTWGEDA